MKFQKHIKEILITTLIISLTTIGYAAVSTVASGDSLTTTIWNDMKAVVDGNTSKLTNISSNGVLVGIGTSSPSAKLDVNGTLSVTGNNGITQLYNSDSTTSVLNGVNDIKITTGGVERMIVKGSGNVGIGTITPTAKLHIKDNVNLSVVSLIENINTGTNSHSVFQLKNDGGKYVSLFLNGQNKVNDGLANDATLRTEIGGGNLHLGAGGTRLVTLGTNGNVGIGTTAPTSKLQVVGLLEYTDNATALAAGLSIGAFYRTGDLLKVVH